ncbi:amidophosphoribosyltransferase [Helicobacter pylori]|nr:amidophosphoribosyltransferase [Helicobacter pylori]
MNDLPLKLKVRVLEGVSVYSFYAYSEIEELIKSKYALIGSRILPLLSQKAGAEFVKILQEQGLNTPLYGIAIDDKIKSFYSHSAALLKGFCQGNLKPTYGRLRANNTISYAGKSLEFRANNPRDFTFKGDKNLDYFLLDDIITTGTTLKEALKYLKTLNIKAHFAIALCSADE